MTIYHGFVRSFLRLLLMSENREPQSPLGTRSNAFNHIPTPTWGDSSCTVGEKAEVGDAENFVSHRRVASERGFPFRNIGLANAVPRSHGPTTGSHLAPPKPPFWITTLHVQSIGLSWVLRHEDPAHPKLLAPCSNTTAQEKPTWFVDHQPPPQKNTSTYALTPTPPEPSGYPKDLEKVQLFSS